MLEHDRQRQIQNYEDRLVQFGYSPLTLDWGENSRQDVRFAVLADLALRSPQSSVLDVGCGFADLYAFLHQKGWTGRYTGVDIVPGLLATAHDRYPGLDLQNVDISNPAVHLGTYDYVIGSGLLNLKLQAEDHATHVVKVLQAMHRHAQKAVCVDFLSTYVDFQKPESWHTNPGWVFDQAKQLSRRVTLRHDYLPYEFAVVIFVDDSLSERKVFQGFERVEQ
jgi:ubiquinone/menaquinone biosynthesis C-methylase UbiE